MVVVAATVLDRGRIRFRTWTCGITDTEPGKSRVLGACTGVMFLAARVSRAFLQPLISAQGGAFDLEHRAGQRS